MECGASQREEFFLFVRVAQDDEEQRRGAERNRDENVFSSATVRQRRFYVPAMGRMNHA
jgi:hypothetical protein